MAQSLSWLVSSLILNPLGTTTADGGDDGVEEDKDSGATNEVDTDEAGMDGKEGWNHKKVRKRLWRDTELVDAEGVPELCQAHHGDEATVLLKEKLLESRIELHPLLITSHSRLKDILFLDLALASAVKTTWKGDSQIYIFLTHRWQVISPVEVQGIIASVNELISVQNKVYKKPTILIATRVTGEEEIPDGVVAVLTPDKPDVLSHVSIRARNSKVCFATCFDTNLLRDLRLKDANQCQ